MKNVENTTREMWPFELMSCTIPVFSGRAGSNFRLRYAPRPEMVAAVREGLERGGGALAELLPDELVEQAPLARLAMHSRTQTIQTPTATRGASPAGPSGRA